MGNRHSKEIIEQTIELSTGDLPRLTDLEVVDEQAATDYLAEFETHLRGRDVSPATVRTYVAGARNFVQWFEKANRKKLHPVAITPIDVKTWRRTMAKELAAMTVNTYLSGLTAFMHWARKAGYAQHDPLEEIGGLKIQSRPLKWLTNQQQWKLRRAIEEHVQLGELRAGADQHAPGNVWPKRDKALAYVLLMGGLRISEAADLDVGDVEINPRSGRLTVRRGKGRKSRTVPLNKDVREALSGWLAVRQHVAMSEEKALFISQKGGRLGKRSCAGRIYVLADRAGMEDIHPHRLRHTCGKNLVDKGVGLERVATILGHADIETTRIYTRPSENDLQADIEKISWSD